MRLVKIMYNHSPQGGRGRSNNSSRRSPNNNFSSHSFRSFSDRGSNDQSSSNQNSSSQGSSNSGSRSFNPRGFSNNNSGGRSFRGGNRSGGRRSFSGGGNFIESYIRRATTISTQIIEETPVTMVINDLPISEKLKAAITARGYVNPTPIQEKAIPAIIEGRDVIGIANTGTGKTAAFLIPIIEKIIQDHSHKTLIITPTRELALQIRDELHSFSRNMPINSAVCIGQSSMRQQIGDLRRCPNVVIGTPGRLEDLARQRYLDFHTFNTIILDEVDQMLDMGFVHEIKEIVACLPPERQSLFFSATITPNIQSIIQSFTKDAVMVSVKTQETTSHIHQEVVKYQSESHKVEVLTDLLGKEELKKVLIFGQTKHGVEKLSQDLFDKGFKAISIHGNKSQSQRQQAIRLFKEDRVNVLVATDVAARGIDIANVSHVINFDPPENYESYIHRIGRTGRADKKGTALTFIRG